MSEANPVQNLAEKQKTAEAIPAAALDWSVGPLLSAQADVLAGAEATVTDWLHRRHEAIVDTQQLIARMQTDCCPQSTAGVDVAFVSAFGCGRPCLPLRHTAIDRACAFVVPSWPMELVHQRFGRRGHSRIARRSHAGGRQAFADGKQ